MARSEIYAGICGFKTEVETRMEGTQCTIQIKSDCEAMQRLAEELCEIDPFREISFRGDGPRTLKLGTQYCTHTACPVPVGIIKAIEIEAGLALPADVTIRLSK
ncbi:MAG: hypothetical protein KAJ18_12675 [Candidatus Omnitrophica bacterium]|nr:hypothetical protein [Candidatus Omnitrophota bacterium]